jgi:hypothetical protein
MPPIDKNIFLNAPPSCQNFAKLSDVNQRMIIKNATENGITKSAL